MKEITASGLTVDEAVKSALAELNVGTDEVEINVISEGKRGFLGLFGQKPATVHIKLKVNPVEEARKFLIDVIKKMNIEADIDVEQGGRQVLFSIRGKEIALLIGKRGQTLNSLQYLTQLVANRYSKQYLQIIVDAENYRERRKATLSELAKRLARQVVKDKKEVKLEPMPSYERKVIHAALASIKGIKTSSIGEDPNRYIVISPK
ncbi:RNA-binding cell elongation regulator Jag/EloR [Metabacillus fastidiosus]|uniref:RNA-binding cell elongation regulator Jag/EloR n=1 Tax=Metabacillus fastidiosus TaxID=1458 RepID=UPI000826CEF5|nr:RNA-binding cell elongation regulator Jag/EloR [Metabacillus fastidiosus]MED4460645.1 RNA-binding cell elongation regulator Jag/EloR [Metabacillus fastidiosus]